MRKILNFCVLDFGNDSSNRKVVAEANVNPPFSVFAHNSNYDEFENLKALIRVEFENL